MPSYSTVHAIMRQLDPGLVTLTHDDAAAYRDQFELIHRHRSDRPNTLWQADHTELDLMILAANGNPAWPWLTVVIDDHSRAIAGYAVFFGAPSALQLALALRRAIWRKADPAWPICGIPDVLYVDHGSDFTSRHLKQVTADLRVELTFSTVGRPQGRGKVERFFGTVTSDRVIARLRPASGNTRSGIIMSSASASGFGPPAGGAMSCWMTPAGA